MTTSDVIVMATNHGATRIQSRVADNIRVSVDIGGWVNVDVLSIGQGHRGLQGLIQQFRKGGLWDFEFYPLIKHFPWRH